MSTPDERFFTTRDGLRLFYRDYRSNEQRTPVICLPGVLSTSRFFEPVAVSPGPLPRSAMLGSLP